MSVAVTFDVFDAFGNQCLTGPGNPYSSGTPTCPASYGATPAGDTSNLYNSEGQLGTTTDPNGITITYNYGDARFPTAPTTSVTPFSGTTTHVYDADGNQIQTQDAEGPGVTTAYDADGRECYRAPEQTSAACSAPPALTGVSVYSLVERCKPAEPDG